MKNQKAKVLVERTIKEYQAKMYLQGWTFNVDFAKQDNEFDTFIVADVCVLHQYMSARITFYPRFLKQTPADQVQTVVHELAHCHTQPALNAIAKLRDGGMITQDQVHDIIERMTQTLAVIALQHGMGK